jgi:polar amino acid transport system substrate-binding protein
MRIPATIRAVAVSATLALTLTACGGNGETGAPGTESPGGGAATGSPTATGAATPTGGDTAAADLNLVSQGRLTVCSDIPYEPFEFEEGGEFTGFDIDLVRAIAQDLGLELQVQVTPFDAIQSGAALAAGQCDLAASAMTITEDREKNVDFSDPYFDADQSLLIRAEDEDTYQSLEDLAGQTIGVQAATTGAMYAEENAPEDATIREFEGAADLFAAMEAGQIEAILQDFPVNAFRATQDDSLVVTEQFPTGEQYGFAVQEEGSEALLEAVNQSLATLRDNGTYDQIFAEYFGEPPPDQATPGPGTASPSPTS